jgi:hypothetical protein
VAVRLRQRERERERVEFAEMINLVETEEIIWSKLRFVADGRIFRILAV